jgi:hypothetical protein
MYLYVYQKVLRAIILNHDLLIFRQNSEELFGELHRTIKSPHSKMSILAEILIKKKIRFA